MNAPVEKPNLCMLKTNLPIKAKLFCCFDVCTCRHPALGCHIHCYTFAILFVPHSLSYFKDNLLLLSNTNYFFECYVVKCWRVLFKSYFLYCSHIPYISENTFDFWVNKPSACTRNIFACQKHLSCHI